MTTTGGSSDPQPETAGVDELAKVIDRRLSWASLHWFTMRTRGGIKSPVISPDVAPALAEAIYAAGWRKEVTR